MSEQQPLEPTEIHRPDDGNLPVPATERAVTRQISPREIVRLANRTVARRPVLTASVAALSVVGAAAAAAVTGTAALTRAARLLWPGSTGQSPLVRALASNDPADLPGARPTWPAGPSVHLRYTRVEIRWSARP